MKKVIILISLLIPFLFYSFNNSNNQVLDNGQDSIGPYIDGKYTGKSRARYTESYYGNVEITVKNGWITEINFQIIDVSNNEVFDSTYEKHFVGNEYYILQCRSDWKGVNTYPGKLLEAQDINKVDAITGATWSYFLFKYSTNEALKNATKTKTGIKSDSWKSDENSIQFIGNPFQSKIRINYNLPKTCFVNLSVYDSSGKIVKQLINQVQQEGKQSVIWNECPVEGIYFCRLQAGNNIYKGKIVKMRD